MPTEYHSSYQIKWRGRLPEAAPYGVSARNWRIFLQHVTEGRSMYSVAAEHEITRARISAIISRVNQLLVMADQTEETPVRIAGLVVQVNDAAV